MKRKKLISLVIVGLTVATAAVWLILAGNDTYPVDRNDSSTTVDDNPTDEPTDENPTDEKPIDDKPTTSDTPGVAPDEEVTPFITSFGVSGGTLTARGFVPSILEDGGTCKYVLKNSAGTTVKSAQTTGFVDATYTGCPAVSMSVSNLASGKYRLALEYSSSSFSGVSEVSEVLL